MDDSEKESFKEVDFGAAWSHPHAFALIKMGIQKMFMDREDFSPDNPYEELSERVTTTGMIRSAYDLGLNIEVRYGWEMLDDDNIVMHSCFGTVEKIDISINADEGGFLMRIDEEEYAAFSYKSIFWVCKADIANLNN